MLSLLLLSSAPAADHPELVPGPAQLREATATLDDRLVAVDVARTAVARTHNALAEAARSADLTRPPCDDPVWSSLGPRTGPLGALHRDSAQAARAQLARVERLAAAETIAPVADTVLADRLEGLVARVRDAERDAAELRAWQGALVEPWLARCSATLAPGAGLGALPTGAPSVVIGIGGGRVCPTAAAADGTAVLVERGVACVDAGDCRCTPELAAPGAVIGPR